jgi:hypothetical protein
MRRFYFSIPAAMVALLLAWSPALAAMTPQAAVGQCPDLPSVAQLVNGDTGDFHKRISALEKGLKEATDTISADVRETATADAERLTRQQTGRSVAELQNMGKAEQQALADQMVAKQLAAAGMGNMSLSQLQGLKGKSEAEMAQAVTAGGARPSNAGARVADGQAQARIRRLR